VAGELESGPPGVQPLVGLALLASIVTSLLAAPGAEGLSGAYLAALMLAIAATDARRYRIPNELTATAIALALIRAGAITPDAGAASVLWVAFRAVVAALPLLLLMLLYRLLKGRDGLGLGDVKLVAVAGAWLDFATVIAVIEVAALSAIAAYAATAALRKKPWRATAFLPFGLFLAPTIWIGWLAERWLVDWLPGWPG
jgi:leader peptidase (prepilin peptidase)/N-methyltransferase